MKQPCLPGLRRANLKSDCQIVEEAVCLCMYITVTRMFIWMRRTDREPSGGLLAESKVGGATDAFVTLTREASSSIAAAEWYSTLVSRVLRALACKHLPAQPTRTRPCPVLITTPASRPLYAFEFFCFCLARTQDVFEKETWEYSSSHWQMS